MGPRPLLQRCLLHNGSPYPPDDQTLILPFPILLLIPIHVPPPYILLLIPIHVPTFPFSHIHYTHNLKKLFTYSSTSTNLFTIHSLSPHRSIHGRYPTLDPQHTIHSTSPSYFHSVLWFTPIHPSHKGTPLPRPGTTWPPTRTLYLTSLHVIYRL